MNRSTAVLEAAAARAADLAGRQTGRASKPAQRRSEEQTGVRLPRCDRGYLPPVAARTQVEVRDLDGTEGPLVFDGFASVTGQAYRMWDAFGEYREIVHVGSFTETLAQPGLDVPLVIDHVSSRRIARTVTPAAPLLLSEVTEGDRTGLHVLAPNLDRSDPDVAYIVPKLRSGLIDEMSFRFLITSGRWSDDWTEFHIHAVDIDRGDVAIVGYGANPLTTGAGLRGLSAFGDDELRAEVTRRGLIVDVQAPAPVLASRSPEEERRAALHRLLDAAGAGR